MSRAPHRIRRHIALAVSLVLMVTGVWAGAAGATTRGWEMDRGYGDGGLVHLNGPGSADSLDDLVPGPDGSSVAVGWTGTTGDIDTTVTRLRPDGTPDPAFGGGEVVIDLGYAEMGHAAAIQPDGKVIVAGWTDGNPITGMFAVRLLPSGDFDPDFAEGGVFFSGIQIHVPESIDVGPDGSIVIGGLVNAGFDQVDTAVLRLTPDGFWDETFGDGGLAVVSIGEMLGELRSEYIESVAVTADGGVLAAGKMLGDGVDGVDSSMFLLRYLADGTLDPSYGDGGLVVPRPERDGIFDEVSDMALLPDGGVVLAGVTGQGILSHGGGTFVARFDAAGRFDPTFGLGAGDIAEGMIGNSSGAVVTLLPDGDGWYAVGAAGPPGSIAIARFDARGRPDPRFGNHMGYQTVQFAPGQPNVRGAVLDGHGGLLVGATYYLFEDRVVGRLLPGDPRLSPLDPTGRSGPGYWMLDESGVVWNFGGVKWYGNGHFTSSPWVDIEPTPSGNGYWLLDARGTVGCFGDARATCGFVPSIDSGDPAVSLSSTPTGKGLWIFTARGRVFAFGDAPAFGDLSTVRLNGPILDSVPTPSGRGYYMVASDGGIFSFGDAVFRGSMGGRKLNAPVQSLVPTPDGAGYWLVASDGGVFAFDAPFRGSMGGTRLNKPVTGMVPFGNGYLMVGADGGIFNMSDRPFFGSLGANPPPNLITSVAAAGDV